MEKEKIKKGKTVNDIGVQEPLILAEEGQIFSWLDSDSRRRVKRNIQRRFKKMKSHILIKNSNGNPIVTTVMDPKLQCFTTLGKGLYAWCEPEDLESVLSGDLGKIKIGEYGSKGKDTLPQKTIRNYSQATTKARCIVWAYRFSDEEIRKHGNPIVIENEWKKKMRFKKSQEGSSTEVYLTSMYEVVDFFTRRIQGVEKPKLNFGFRPTQSEADLLMSEVRKMKYVDFGLFATPRYGKNFVFLKNCLKHGDNLIVAISNRPSVFKEIEKEVDGHVDFKDFVCSYLKDDRKWSPVEGKMNILFVSKQLFDHGNNKEWIKKLILDTNFKSCYIDEGHNGFTPKFLNDLFPILETIPFRVWASGTPYNLWASGRFSFRNSFIYDYIDQQIEKKQGIIDAVTIETYCLCINPKFKNSIYTDEEGYNPTKMFSCSPDTGEFIHKKDVEEWVSEFLGNAKSSKYSPYLEKPDIVHAIAIVNGVNEAKELAKLINQSSTHRAILAVSDEVKDIEEVEQRISDYDLLGYRTITITCERFVEGATEARWQAAFILCNISSLVRYIQFCLRLGSIPHGGKKDRAFVFDYGHQRTLRMTLEMAQERAKRKESNDPSEYLREFLEYRPVFTSKEGAVAGFKKIDHINLIEEVRKTDYARYQVQGLVDLNDTNTKGILKQLSEMEGLSASPSFDLSVFDNDLPNEKTFQSSSPKRGEKPIAGDLEKAKKNVQRILSYIPFFCRVLGVNTLADLIKNLDPDEWEELTGIDKRWISLIESRKLVNIEELNLYLSIY